MAREDGWRAFRIEGILDFSLIGILAKISQALADNGIGLFAISTFNTDYILVKSENLDKAVSLAQEALRKRTNTICKHQTLGVNDEYIEELMFADCYQFSKNIGPHIVFSSYPFNRSTKGVCPHIFFSQQPYIDVGAVGMPTKVFRKRLEVITVYFEDSIECEVLIIHNQLQTTFPSLLFQDSEFWQNVYCCE